MDGHVYFGIEEIGVEIEDPFGEDENDLPLESIAKNTQAFSTWTSATERIR